SGFTLGNGGDDYLITPSNNHVSNDIGGSAFNTIENSVQFTIAGWGTNMTSAKQINSVAWAWASGSLPIGYYTVAAAPTPEPGVNAMLAAMFTSGLGFWIRRRRRHLRQ